ncbi:hypothetical protein G8A07_05265 [Roseateles sp. DAIF2]|uniref:hypothetical protein n=1 Tax=Roseateles sp. DAIF2 TaxID=2714952 RepID=UPI0018A3349E|nr:hypothetical protein [Roseateles sp. DAIF2]QPF71455.1 hypothetical protein G8A07_05265 [Roseateles sp. DAIF2]
MKSTAQRQGARRLLLLAGLGLAGLLCAGAASARDGADVRWSVTIGSPARVYAPPPVAVYPQLYPQAYPRHGAPRAHYQQPTRWDRDGDGIPNRYDRRYNPAWDRDGDGVPNRYDRHDHNAWRR